MYKRSKMEIPELMEPADRPRTKCTRNRSSPSETVVGYIGSRGWRGWRMGGYQILIWPRVNIELTQRDQTLMTLLIGEPAPSIPHPPVLQEHQCLYIEGVILGSKCLLIQILIQ